VEQVALAQLAAAVGGALNAVAGGGSFFTLPALIVAGVAPVAANATSTLALWPASVSSTFAYRGDIQTSRQWLVVLGLTSLVGGLAGALLLVRAAAARAANSRARWRSRQASENWIRCVARVSRAAARVLASSRNS